jgi:hypothetical protein
MRFFKIANQNLFKKEKDFQEKEKLNFKKRKSIVNTRFINFFYFV